MDGWLSGFHYRITIHPILFLIAGAAAFSIAWLTMGYQSLKAALANPVKSLRNE
jgi:putative ABC transport system permease protein